MNEIIFGMSYDRGDALWLHMQELREEGKQNFSKYIIADSGI